MNEEGPPNGEASGAALRLSEDVEARQVWRPQGVGQVETFLRSRVRRAGRIGQIAAQWEAWHRQFSGRLRPRSGWSSLGLEYAGGREAGSETAPIVRAVPRVPPAPAEERPTLSEARFERGSPVPFVPPRPETSLPGREESVETRPAVRAARQPSNASTPGIQRKSAPAVPARLSASFAAPPLARPAVGLSVLSAAPLQAEGASESASFPLRLALSVAPSGRREQQGGFPSPQLAQVRQGSIPASALPIAPERGSDDGRARPSLRPPAERPEAPIPGRRASEVGARAANPPLFPSDSADMPRLGRVASANAGETQDIVDWLLGPDGMPRPLPGLEIRPITPQERPTADAPGPSETADTAETAFQRESHGREKTPHLDVRAVADKVVEQVTAKMQRRERLERERKGLY